LDAARVKTIEYRTVDKSEWGEGPWQAEPDKVQWQDEATGLPCLIVRNIAGCLCGYVGVTAEHPFFGKGYGDVDVEVHGGLTFSGPCNPQADEERHICHVPAEGEPDHVFWFGFDCAHLGDLCPTFDRVWRQLGVLEKIEYKDIEYVRAEVRKLAKQLYDKNQTETET